jgi:hypothetical protein
VLISRGERQLSVGNLAIEEEIVLNWQTKSAQSQIRREDIKEYVAELQLHMTLQARNLLPTLTQGGDNRIQLLQDSQAELEKIVSRQSA